MQKTIEIDIEEESYNRGYEDGLEDTEQSYKKGYNDGLKDTKSSRIMATVMMIIALFILIIARATCG